MSKACPQSSTAVAVDCGSVKLFVPDSDYCLDPSTIEDIWGHWTSCYYFHSNSDNFESTAGSSKVGSFGISCSTVQATTAVYTVAIAVIYTQVVWVADYITAGSRDIKC